MNQSSWPGALSRAELGFPGVEAVETPAVVVDEAKLVVGTQRPPDGIESQLLRRRDLGARQKPFADTVDIQTRHPHVPLHGFRAVKIRQQPQ